MTDDSVILGRRLISALRRHYGLEIEDIEPQSSGEDRESFVYRVASTNNEEYFLKLTGGEFHEASVIVPKYLADLGVRVAMPPIETLHGGLWVNLGTLKVILYPFIRGRNAYETALADSQWHELGRNLKMIHEVELPADLAEGVSRETYSSRWNPILEGLLEKMGDPIVNDPVTERLVRFLAPKKESLLDICRRADQLGDESADCPLEPVLCHADVHAGNVLIDPGGIIYLVDWDGAIFAPKERDLMFIGGGYWGGGGTAERVEALFYRGYGSARIDPVALAYYRYGRIVEDIAIFCERILLGDEGRADRERCLRYLQSSFLSNGTIEIAHRTIRRSPGVS